MKATFQFVNPDDITASITMTATVKEWRELSSQLSTETWPSWDFRSKITDVIRQAEQRFYDNQEGQPHA